LKTTVRYSENRFVPRVVFKQGEQAKSIPEAAMLYAKVGAEPVLHVVVRLGETSVIYTGTIGSRGPSPYPQLIAVLSMKLMHTP